MREVQIQLKIAVYIKTKNDPTGFRKTSNVFRHRNRYR